MGKSILNNSSTLLVAGASFVGTAEDLAENVEIMVSIKSDRNCTVRVEQSATGSNWDVVKDMYYVASDSKNFMVGKVHQFFRTSIINTSGYAMGVLRMATYLQEEYSSAVVKGTDATGIERKIAVDADGKLLMTFVGEVGATGKSAYQVAVDEGFVGTEEQWLLTLRGVSGLQGPIGLTGAQGVQGNTGAAGVDGSNGNDGVDGSDGDSAYQVWLGLGNSGTQSQFIQSLKGASILVKGTLTTAEILAVDIASLSFGDSYFSSDAFSLYVFNGSTWISSGSLRGSTGLQGVKGDTGSIGLQGESILVLGSVADSSELPLDAQIGHAYFVNSTYSLSVSRGPGLWSTSLSLRGATGAQGVQGEIGLTGNVGAGLVAKGSVADLTALNAIPSPSAGDLYIVESDYKMYIYDGVAFQNSGVSMRGETGQTGEQGVQGNTGSVGLTGNSLVVMGNMASVGALPTGYDADDVGKAWFINDQFIMAVWNGSAFSYSASLRGATGAQGVQGDSVTGDDGKSINFLGSVADATALASASAGWGVSDLNKAYFQTDIFAIKVWNGSAFDATGSLRGVQGEIGLTGAQGVQGYNFQFIGNAASSLITGTIANGLGVADTGKTYMGTDNFSLYFWNGSGFDTSFPVRGAPGVDGSDGVDGADGSDGSDGANLLAKGNVADAAALSSKVATAVVGDMWFQDDTYTANVFDGTAFQSSGSLRGASGVAGQNATIPTPTILTYELSSGSTGGQAPGINAWHTRPLNGLINSNQNGGVSLSNNVITMGSTGVYKISFMSVVFQTGNNKARLYRINGMTGTIATGSNSRCATGGGGESSNMITANLSAGDQLELQHYVTVSSGVADYGAPVSSGDAELYARVVIEKLS